MGGEGSGKGKRRSRLISGEEIPPSVFSYSGPVKDIGNKILNPKWTGETTAVSRSKALSNLAIQYKRQTNRMNGVKIRLDDHFLYKED